MKNFLLSLLVIGLSPMAIFAQTGPAGVGTAGTNPLWIDANELNLSNGAAVSTFTDVSGNGNDMVQLTSSRQPTYTDAVINGMPAVVFDGTTDFLERGATSGLDGNAITIFAVFQRTLANQECVINAGYTAQLDKWRVYDPGNNRITGLHKSPGAKNAFFIDATGNPLFTSTHFRAAGTRMYNSGTLSGSQSSPYTAEAGHNLLRVGTYNWNVTNYHLDGFIAEIVVLNFDPNNLQRRLIENYLGNKYGFAIPNDWYAYESTHNVGIIGIGNDGTNTHTDSQGSGVLQVNGATDLGSGEYLLCGHTNVDLDQFTTSDLPGSLPTHQRWTRSWRAGETGGDVGDVTLTFHLAGGNNFGSSADYRLLIDNATQDGDFSDAAIKTGTYDAGSQTMKFSINLADGDFFTLCGIEQQLDIHSILPIGNWSLPATWDCACIPTQNDRVFIDPGHSITVDVDAECDSLYIDPTATLNMTSAVNLNIVGSFENDGTTNFTDGSVSFIGDVEQTIDAGSNGIAFNDLTLDNNGANDINIIGGEVLINGILDPESGNLDIDPAADFIINSTSSTTGGRVGPIGGGFSQNGDVTVRRFIPAGNADWRDLSCPVQGATLATWDPDLEISCDDCPDGCAAGQGTACFESATYWAINTQYGISTITQPLESGKGYEVWVGDDLNNWSGGTLNSKGMLHTGDVPETVSSYWYTAGNPYACPVDFDLLGFSGVGKYFYIYDTQAGDWQWYDLNSATSSTAELADGIIETGQGIWVKGPGTLTFTQGDKVLTDDGTYIRTQSSEDQSIYVKLSENSGTFSSTAAIENHIDGTDGYDDLFDVSHLEMEHQKGPSIAFITGEELVRKSYLAKNFMSKVLPVHTTFKNDGYYTISIENIANFPDYNHVYIVDAETGDQVDLVNENYIFYALEGTQDERFHIILTNEEVIQSSTASFNSLEDNGVEITQLDHVLDVQVTGANLENVEITLVNTLGQVEMYFDITTLIEGSNIINIPAEVSGMRILTINNNGRLITKKLVF